MKGIEKTVEDGNARWTGSFLFPRTVPLHSMLAGCGYETCRETSYDFDGLQRGQAEFAIFQYTIDGEGTLDYEGTLHKLHSGEAMILHVPHRHRYYLAGGSEFWRHCYLTIAGSDAVRLMRESESRFGAVAALPRDSAPIRKMLHILELGRTGKLKSACTASALTYDFVTSLYDCLSSGSSAEGHFNRQLLKNVHQFCLNHLTEDLDVTAMANESGYSRAHFSREFKRLYGIPPAQFLKELRLSSAIRMLQMDSGSIKEIADRCGFRDESYFCKVFRKYYHVSPEKFRRGRLSQQ